MDDPSVFQGMPDSDGLPTRFPRPLPSDPTTFANATLASPGVTSSPSESTRAGNDDDPFTIRIGAAVPATGVSRPAEAALVAAGFLVAGFALGRRKGPF